MVFRHAAGPPPLVPIRQISVEQFSSRSNEMWPHYAVPQQPFPLPMHCLQYSGSSWNIQQFNSNLAFSQHCQFLVRRAVQCIELMNVWLRLTIFLWLSLNFTREFLDSRRIRSLFNVPTVGGLSDCNFNTYWAVRWHGPQLIPWERGVPVPWAQRPVGHWVALP